MGKGEVSPLAPPEPPILKKCNTGMHLAFTLVTCGMWGLFVWWPLHEGYKAQNKRKLWRYAADMSVYNHGVWEAQYRNR